MPKNLSAGESATIDDALNDGLLVGLRFADRDIRANFSASARLLDSHDKQIKGDDEANSSRRSVRADTLRFEDPMGEDDIVFSVYVRRLPDSIDRIVFMLKDAGAGASSRDCGMLCARFAKYRHSFDTDGENLFESELEPGASKSELDTGRDDEIELFTLQRDTNGRWRVKIFGESDSGAWPGSGGGFGSEFGSGLEFGPGSGAESGSEPEFRPEPVALQRGQNVKLAGISDIFVQIGWNGAELDISAFLLGQSGKVTNDADFVFYNQPAHPSGAAELDGKTIRIALNRVPTNIGRVAFSLASFDNSTSFSAVSGLYLGVGGNGSASAYMFSPAQSDFASETAVVLAEIYRKDGVWRLKAIGRGWHGGLEALCREFGVNIA